MIKSAHEYKAERIDSIVLLLTRIAVRRVPLEPSTQLFAGLHAEARVLGSHCRRATRGDALGFEELSLAVVHAERKVEIEALVGHLAPGFAGRIGPRRRRAAYEAQ